MEIKLKVKDGMYRTLISVMNAESCTVPGARTDKRVKWNGYSTIFERNQMVSYTVGRFLQADQWLLNRGIPYESGFVVLK